MKPPAARSSMRKIYFGVIVIICLLVLASAFVTALSEM
jgi:hypothetical protein